MFNSSFPKTTYTFYPNGVNGASADIVEVVDMMRRVRFLDTFGAIKNYKTYTIKGGETPDIVSAKLYGSSEWYWLIMIFNNLTDPFSDWPRDGYDQTLPAVNEDTIHYLPGGTGSYDQLYPYNVGDTVIRLDSNGLADEDEYSSTITRVRGGFFGFDLSIPASTGTRLSVGQTFGVVDSNGDISNINSVKRLENPITTAVNFQTEDGRDLSPYTWRSSIGTTEEKILNPSEVGGPLSNLTTTLVYEWVESTEAYEVYARTVIYQSQDRSDRVRKLKVFPNDLKESAHRTMVSLLNTKPSGGRTGVIRSANSNNLSLL